MSTSNENEYLGFMIRKDSDISFAVVRNNKTVHTASTEKLAKRWVSRFRKMVTRSLSLRQASEDLILFAPVIEQPAENSNIIAIASGPESEIAEKSIKIISKKNGQPQLDIKNLDSNEVLGLMRRAEYMITNIVLRNGTL